MRSLGWFSYLRGVGENERFCLGSIAPSVEIQFERPFDFFSQAIGHVVHVQGGMGASYYSQLAPLSSRSYSVYQNGVGHILVGKNTLFI